MMHQRMFLFLGAGMVYRLFTKDCPQENSSSAMARYLALLFGLGAFLFLARGA
jgi:hypothetical protein